MGAFFVVLKYMKTVLFCFIILMSINTCSQENISLNYLAQSRGFYLKIEVQNNDLKVISEREAEPKTKELSNETLKDIEKLIANVSFDDVHLSDDSRSSFDAAAMAEFRCTFNNETHEYAFDHGSPPEELKQLIEKIIVLAESLE